MEWQASLGRTITWMRSYFIYWLSSKCLISFCFPTVGKSNIAELWKGGRFDEQNKILSLELCRCIKAELLQQQDFVKLHLHSVRCISEEKGQNQPEQEHSFPSRAKWSSWKMPPTHCTVTASEMGHTAEHFGALCVQKCDKYNSHNHFSLKSVGLAAKFLSCYHSGIYKVHRMTSFVGFVWFFFWAWKLKL